MKNLLLLYSSWATIAWVSLALFCGLAASAQSTVVAEGVDMVGDFNNGTDPYNDYTLILGFGTNQVDLGSVLGATIDVKDDTGLDYGVGSYAPTVPGIDPNNQFCVVLTTATPLDLATPGRFYVITYSNLTCNGGSPCEGVYTNYIMGSILCKHFQVSSTSGTVAELLTEANFIANNPDEEFVKQAIEQPQSVGPYGLQFLGYFQPPVYGNYTFYDCGDGNSIVYLSTNSSPLNQVQICTQPSYSSMRQWNNNHYQTGGPYVGPPTDTNKVSAPIALVAGQKYFLQVIFEGPGNDGKNVAVTWTDDQSDLPPVVDQSTPVSKGLIPWEPTNGYVSVSPASINVAGGHPFQLNSSSLVAPGGPNTYQWYLNGLPIAGANGLNYTNPVAFPTNSGEYTVVLTTVTPVVNFTSAPVSVTVGPVDTTPPVLNSMYESNDTLIVSFDKPMNLATGSNPNNYRVGGIALPAFISISISPDYTTLYLEFSTPYYLTNMTPVQVSGVQDGAGNTIVTTNYIVLDPQILLKHFATTITSGQLADLLTLPDFVNNNPDYISIQPDI